LFKKKSLKFYVLFTYLSASTFAIFKLTKQTYGVNDDVIIQNWLSGFYTGTPELMIRGSATPRISFGFIVSNLYELIPSVNWFSIILLGVTLLSWSLLGLLAFRSNNYLVITVYFVISFLHLLWFIPSPTYTSAAVILSFSSLIFLSKQITEGRVNFSILPITFAYVFSFFIRPESFLLGSAVTVPFILFAVIKNQQVIRQYLKLILTSLLVVVSSIGIDVAFEKIYYSNNTNWTEYREWERARYKIQANAPEKAVLESPAKYGWTKSEAEIFKNYNSIDPNYFTGDKLNKLIIDSQSETKIDFKFLQKAHQQIFDSDINWEWKRLIQLISLVFLLFLLLSLPKSSNFLLLSISSFAIVYLIMLYVAGFLRQPERVQVSVIFVSILVSWASFIFSKGSQLRNKIDQYSFLSWLLFVLIVSSTYTQSLYLKTKVAGASNAFWLTESKYLSDFPDDSIFVGNASQFRNNWSSPYIMDYFDVEKRIMSFGWHNFSPHWAKRAQNLGLDPNNMFNSVIEDPRVYWVSDPESMEYIVSYMKERNYNFTGPEIVGEMDYVGNEYIVWNFNPRD
jgi:hypothetical protein